MQITKLLSGRSGASEQNRQGSSWQPYQELRNRSPEVLHIEHLNNLSNDHAGRGSLSPETVTHKFPNRAVKKRQRQM
ncbi:hypothetical protein E2C01_011434 [Portunus trituberculatus]|uniref:Uncharacterized protein n=1 Tax=Portunus trituberculatus TaxID=210409 RepID=A0A5B7DBA0_PORTR|nr:hypothetical protein [Portunus trituberculatus]